MDRATHPIKFNRAGHGQPLLLIHGVGSCKEVWAPLVPLLTSTHEVIAVDVPGFGESEPLAPSQGADPVTFAKVLGDFLESQGLQNVHAVGNSMGGFIALEMARLGLVSRVTALSPGGFGTQLQRKITIGLLRAAGYGLRPISSQVDILVALPGVQRLSGSLFFADPNKLSKGEFTHALRMLAASPVFDKALSALAKAHFRGDTGVPTTIAWAEHDRVLPSNQLEHALQVVPNARGVTLKGCGHVPTFDDPEQIAALIKQGAA